MSASKRLTPVPTIYKLGCDDDQRPWWWYEVDGQPRLGPFTRRQDALLAARQEANRIGLERRQEAIGWGKERRAAKERFAATMAYATQQAVDLGGSGATQVRLQVGNRALLRVTDRRWARR